MEPKKLYKLVYEYPTKYKEGFLPDEIKEILKTFPNINMDKYNDAMGVHTVIIIENDIITFHNDILTAFKCGIENRDITIGEFD